MRELPRKLVRAELEEVFGGPSALVDRLVDLDDPLDHAEDVALSLDERDQAAALAQHARIGEPSPEQRGSDPTVVTELAYLNQLYEEKFGFRFVVFVAGRSRAELLPVLRERLERTREEELETGCDELVAIAVDRWRSS
jgi:2-oxo-4-hydroxy-4-carboxy-5-ureidoimidazoline decarboxylase